MALLQLEVTHSIIQGALGNKKSFRADVPLHEVKEKLSMIVGTEPRFQKLQLCDPETQAVIMELDDVDLTLNDYGAQRDWVRTRSSPSSASPVPPCSSCLFEFANDKETNYIYTIYSLCFAI